MKRLTQVSFSQRKTKVTAREAEAGAFSPWESHPGDSGT
jgi:hypothetical protein